MSTHVVIPMAGSGERFRQAGYALPKPFVDVLGRPMIERVLQNLRCDHAHYTLITRREHAPLLEPLKAYYPIDIVWCDKPTGGAAETVLLARHHITPHEPLLLANSDQLVDVDMHRVIANMKHHDLDGMIVTFEEPSRDPKWSYAQVDERGLVVKTKEKQPISDQATAGIYLFTKGGYFLEAADQMIAANDRTNGEFYVCPAYNYMIRAGYRVGIYPLPNHAMHGLGTPEDLKRYLALPRS